MTDQIDSAEERHQIRPLTRISKSGVPYQRTTKVNTQIESVIDMDTALLVKRAQLPDEESTDYLREEVLVYFIRIHHRLGDEAVVDDLAKVLLVRCAGRISRRLRALGRFARDDAYQDVVKAMFERILDPESDRADFMEIRFWMALKNLIIDVFRRHNAQLENEENVDNFSSLESTLTSNAGEDGPILEERISGEALSVEEKVVLQEALGVLKEPYRTAFLLRYGEEWQIESNDPSTITISEYFGKTPRTIRNWLAIAQEQLKRWRDERNEDA